MKSTRVLIIGAGVAGLSCALYLQRAGLSPLVLEKGAPGGKLLTIAEIRNYPGFSSIGGFELAQAMLESATSQGVTITSGEVLSVSKEAGHFRVDSRDEVYLSEAVVVASGLSNVPTIPGEKEHLGKGVSYCATCDGPLLRKKTVALYGTGEKALEEALYLAPLVAHLYFLSPNANETSPLLQNLLGQAHVEMIPEAKVLQIKGETMVQSMIYEQKGQKKEVDIAAIFPLLGEKSASGFLAGLAPKLEHGFLVVDEHRMSSVAGLFGAGDIVAKPLRQVVTAAGDGANASEGVLEYLRHLGVK